MGEGEHAQKTEGGWTVGLLNTFRLERDGEIVAQFYDRKQDLLLAYLALHSGRPHLRDKIARTLWPGKVSRHRRNRLSESLHLLKKRLAELGIQEDAILADRHSLRLNPEIACDIRQFERRFAEALEEADQEKRVGLLEELVAAYGDGLLPDLDETWVQAERERLTVAYRQLVQALSGAGQVAVVDLADELPGSELARYHHRARMMGGGGIHRHTGGTGPPPAESELEARDIGSLIDAILEDVPTSAQELQRRFCERYVALAEEAEPHLLGPGRRQWIGRLEGEREGLHQALEWAIENEERLLALRLAGALWHYWFARGYVDVGRAYVEQALMTGPTERTTIEAKALNGAGALALHIGDSDRARRRLEEALSIWREIEGYEGVARSLANLGIVAYKETNYSEARRFHEQALEVTRSLNRPDVLAGLLGDAALVEIADEEYDRAEELLQERLAITQGQGDRIGVARATASLGTVAQYRGDYEAARVLSEQALRTLEEETDLRGVAFAALSLGHVLHHQGRYADARTHYAYSLEVARGLGDMQGVAESLRYLGKLSHDQGDSELATRIYKQSVAMLRDAGDSRGVARVEEALVTLVRETEGAEAVAE